MVAEADHACFTCGNPTDRPATPTGHHLCHNCETELLAARGWTIPRPIQTRHETLPTLALPQPLRDAITHIAHTRNVDPAIPYTAYMALLSTIAGHRHNVQVNPTWHSPLNLYLLVIAESGDGKSPGFTPAAQMLHNIDRIREKAIATDRTRAKAQLAAIKTNLKTAIADEDWDKVIHLEGEKEQLQARVDREAHISFVDITPEALVDYLEANGEIGCTLDDEGTVLQHALGMYATKPNVQLLLRAWDAAPYTSQRRSTKTRQHLTRPILGIAAAIQPTVINQAASKTAINERGLLARFLISWPQPKAGHRFMPENVTDDRPVLELHKHIEWMWDNTTEQHIRTLTFSPEALEVFTEWHDQIERNLRNLDVTPADQRIAAKVRGSVPRIAAIFHLLQNRGGDTIGTDEVLYACQLGDFHMRAAQAIDIGVETAANAHRILRWLKTNGQDEADPRTIRTSLSFHKAGRTQDMYDALNLLIETGWIATDDDAGRFPDVGRQIGKQIPNIIVNPHLWTSRIEEAKTA